MAEHLHAIGVKLRQEARKGQPRLLNARDRDATIASGGAAEQPKAEGLARVVEQLPDANDRQYFASSSRITA